MVKKFGDERYRGEEDGRWDQNLGDVFFEMRAKSKWEMLSNTSIHWQKTFHRHQLLWLFSVLLFSNCTDVVILSIA